MSNIDHVAAFKRICEKTNCRTQIELATVLGIRQSSISDAKRRGAIPAEWLLKLLRIKGVNPEWVLTGEGSVYLTSTEDYTQVAVAQNKQVASMTDSELIHELQTRHAGAQVSIIYYPAERGAPAA